MKVGRRLVVLELEVIHQVFTDFFQEVVLTRSVTNRVEFLRVGVRDFIEVFLDVSKVGVTERLSADDLANLVHHTLRQGLGGIENARDCLLYVSVLVDETKRIRRVLRALLTEFGEECRNSSVGETDSAIRRSLHAAHHGVRARNHLRSALCRLSRVDSLASHLRGVHGFPSRLRGIYTDPSDLRESASQRDEGYVHRVEEHVSEESSDVVDSEFFPRVPHPCLVENLLEPNDVITRYSVLNCLLDVPACLRGFDSAEHRLLRTFKDFEKIEQGVLVWGQIERFFDEVTRIGFLIRVEPRSGDAGFDTFDLLGRVIGGLGRDAFLELVQVQFLQFGRHPPSPLLISLPFLLTPRLLH